jgi:hypothetical protein
MSVNNKELIKPLLTFPKPEDSFYFVQILQRKKDHKGTALGGSNNNSRLIKAYYINSLEKLEVHWEEMIKLAELFNARVSINLNPRSFEKAGFQLLSKVAHQMENKDFYNIRKAYDSVLGNYHAEMDKRWLIDLDKDQMHFLTDIETFVQEEHSKLKSHEKVSRYHILGKIPSKSGLHLITNPFNLEKWKWPDIEIHRNNPTNLFIP